MSKLRANEIVNHENTGSPSFPYGATSPAPTADDQFANKLYTDSVAPAVSSDIKNTVSSNPPESPTEGDFWTDTSKARISLKIWNGDSWVFVKNSRERLVGQVVSPPTIINPNLSNPSGFVKIIPTMLTRESAVVANARFVKSQWYKDGVPIAQHTTSDAVYYVTEVGTYKYEETWVDDFAVELTTSKTMIINADAGTINEQPIMASTNGALVPTTLNVTRPIVSAATFSEVKWYKDGVVIPGLTGLGLTLSKNISEIGTYTYEETWIDEFGSPVVPTVSLEIAAPRGVIDAEAVMSSSDGIYYPTTLNVARPVVSEATFVETKWYKNGVEIPGETGLTLEATEMATFKYQETWVDMYGDLVTPSVSMFISARDGVVDAQPVITDPKSHLSAPQTLPVVPIIPTTLTATRPTVSHAVFNGSQWYKDGEEISGATGVVIPIATLNVSELGTYKYEETWVDEHGVEVTPTQSIVIHANTGIINSPPTISDSNGGYIPTSMTAAPASVSDATLTSSKWYKDDVEISGETGSTYYTSEMGTYKYEQIWIDDLGNVLTTSATSVITAHAGVIDAQPTLASSDGTYYPTTLTVSRPTVTNHVTYVGSKWYKDGVEISGATGFEYEATEMAVYKYEETWVDIFGTQLKPTVSSNILARPGVVDSDPSISNPQAGIIPIIPTTLTATSPNVSHANFVESKWYKDGAEITESAGLKFLYVSELGTYKYEETWVDEYGTQLFPSLTTIIDANSGSVNSQPTISDSNSGYIPTTLTAEASEVVNATFQGSKWYKDGVEISGETGSVLQVGSTSADMGTYKYQEIWVDNLGTEFIPSASMVITARPSVVDALPAISSSDGSFYPTTLTAAQATVSNASFVGSQWYKDGVAIPGATGFVVEATEMAEFRYQETWVDLFGSQISARAEINVNARPGTIDSQPSISNPKAGSTPIIPTTLTATRPTVSHAVFSGSKWYKNGSLIADATGLQLSVTEVGSYKYEETWVDEYGTVLTPSLTAVVNADAGSIDVPPSITSSDGIYYPTTLTGVSPVVTNANYVSSQWYKDDVAISGATGSTYQATEMATYKYEETWADDLGTQLFPSTSMFVSARDGSIDSQPTIASSEGTYYPTTLTATRPTVSNATFSGSKWYKNGVAIPGPTAANLALQATEMATYKYEETWVDEFGVQLLPSLSIDIVARPGVVDSQPSITNPQAGSTPIIPTTLTATRPTVSHADFVVSKWYKDDVEILGATGVELDVTELGVYEYEEVWVDEYGTQLLPSFVSVVHADAGSIDSQPTISDSNGGYIPTTLTAVRPTVSNADFASAQWYKDETPLTETYSPQTSSVVNVVDKSIVGGAWTEHDPNVGSGWMVFGVASSPSVMVAAGAVNDGSNSGANIDGNRKIRYTTDGVNWNWGTTSLSGQYISPHKIVYNPNRNQWVFVCQGENGYSNLVHYSSNGINWSQASHPANVRLNTLAYDGNNYVATSFIGEHCIISSNGTSWSNGGNMGGTTAAGLAGGNGVFIAVDGNSNRIRRSTNGGSSWDSNIYVQSGIQAEDVETDGSGTWVIVSDGSSNRTSNGNYVLYSTDNGQNWSEVSSSTSSYKKVAYGNGKWVFTNGSTSKVCDTNNGGDITDASTWVNGLNNYSAGSSIWDFSYGQFNASPTGEVWMRGAYPNHWYTYSPLSGKTSYELELSDNSIDGVSDQTIGDLFTTNSYVSGTSGGYGRLESTADNSTNKMTLVNAGGTWSVGDVVIRSTQTTRPYSSQSLDATEMGTYRYEETWVDDIGTQLKPSANSVITAYPGSIDTHPTISDSNGGYIPTVMTATQATVSNATFVSSQWYRYGHEIPGATGSTYNVTTMGRYRYVETWVDAFGTEHKAMRTVDISALPGSIDAQPVITDPKGHLSAPQALPVVPIIPTTLTATSPTVSNATFVSSQWYKNGSPVTGATGLTLSVTELGIYRYEETWVDAFGTEHKPSETSIIRTNAGHVATAPSISDSNGGYIPTVLTAARPTVSYATFIDSKWYKDDVEISSATDQVVNVSNDPSSMGTYRYEETWTDDLGNTITTSDSSVITAYAGAISSQPSISSSNGIHYPSTLTATPATVTNATLVGYKWYQDDVLIPGANGLVYQATAMAKYKYEETWVDAFGTELTPSVSIVVVAHAGTIDVSPSITDNNGGYLPSKIVGEAQTPLVLTATSPTVSNASFVESKWYKNATELTAESGNLQISVTEMATYGYLEIWVDEFGTELLASTSTFIAYPPAEVVTQPTISDTNGGFTPTVMTATSPVVQNAAFSSSQWYKDGEAIPSATTLTQNATSSGTYKYEETWIDVNGKKSFVSASVTLTPFNVIETPTVLTPTDDEGFATDPFITKSSNVTSVTTTPGGGKLGNLPEHSEWSNLAYGVIGGQPMYVAIAHKGTYGISTLQTVYHYRDQNRRQSCNKIAYSTDGINWNEATVPNDIHWKHIVFGEVNGVGRFVALGNTRHILNPDEYSEDQRHTGDDYGTLENNAMYSDDGINWTSVSIPTKYRYMGQKAMNWKGLAYSGGQFFAVSDSTAFSFVWSMRSYSDHDFLIYGDGTSWATSNLGQLNTWSNIAGNPNITTQYNGSFLAVAEKGIYNSLGYPAGGIPGKSTGSKFISWINPSVTHQNDPPGHGQYLYDYPNKHYYGYPAYNMSRAPEIADETGYTTAYNEWTAVVYGDNKWVVVSRAGTHRIAFTGPDVTANGGTSDGGWIFATTTTIEDGDDAWETITYGEPGGNPTFIIAGPDSMRYSSSNGYTGTGRLGNYLEEWKDCVMPQTVSIVNESIQWAGDKFVALGTDLSVNKEVFVYSNDGINWSSDYTHLVLSDTAVTKVSDGSAIVGTSVEDVFTPGKRVELPPNIGVSEYWAVAFGGERVGEENGQDSATDMVVDDDGNVYTIGYLEYPDAEIRTQTHDAVLTKHNSLGHLEWHRVMGDRYIGYTTWGQEVRADRQDFGRAIDLDDDGNIYTMIISEKATTDNETPGPVITKYDNSGNMKWQRTLTKPGDKTFDFSQTNSGISVNSAGDVYLIGGITEKGTFVNINGKSHFVTPESLFIAKYNTSGTLMWQRTLDGARGNDYEFSDIVLDSSNNAYLLGSAKITGHGAATNHMFGSDVAVGSGKVVVGCPDNEISDGTRPGAVYVYDLNGTAVSNEIKISPPEGAHEERFGGNIGIDSDKIIISSDDQTGTGYTDNTTIYVYNLDGTLETSFEPNNIVGQSLVAVGSGKIAVAHKNDGTIEIYDLSGNLETTITTPLKTVPSNETSYSNYSQPITSIAVGEDKVAVGSYYAKGAGAGNYGYPDNGIVYVYNLDGTGETSITPSDIQYRSNELTYEDWYRTYSVQVLGADDVLEVQKKFGTSITIGDGKIAISAPGQMITERRYHRRRYRTLRDENSELPAVYVYDLDGTNEVKINQINPDIHDSLTDVFTREQANSNFGDSMCISNGKLVIGATGEDVIRPRGLADPNRYYFDYVKSRYTMVHNSGSVFIYDLDGTNGKRLKNSDYSKGIYQDLDYGRYFYYGSSVAVADGKLIVGATGMELESLKAYNLKPGLAFAYDMSEIQTAPMELAAGDIRFMTGLNETLISASDHLPPNVSQKDALLVKYDSSGSMQWLRKYDNGSPSSTLDAKNDTGAAMAIDASDNVYTIIANSYSGKNFIVKQDTLGSIIWQRSFKLQYTGYRGLTHTIGEESQSNKTIADINAASTSTSLIGSRDYMAIEKHFLAVDSSGNIVIAMQLGGSDNAHSRLSAKIAIIKYDSSGNMLWSRCIGNGVGGDFKTGEETVTGVKTDNAGNIYICGSTASFGPDFKKFYLTDRDYFRDLDRDNDPQSAFIAKLPPDGSLTGSYNGLPYHEFISVPYGTSHVQVVTDLTESSLVHIPDSFIHTEGQLESSRSYMIDETSALVKSTKVSLSAPTAEVFATSGTSVTLSQTGTHGTWSTGDSLHTDYHISVSSTIEAGDPSTLVLVASAPTATRGSINWGLAEWNLAEDFEFTKNVQSITKPLTGSGAQTGPSEFALDRDPRPYYVRVRYLSDDQPDVFSEWSATNTFRTS